MEMKMVLNKFFAFVIIFILFLNITYAQQKKELSGTIKKDTLHFIYSIVRNDSANLRLFVVVDRKLLDNYSKLISLTKFLIDSLKNTGQIITDALKKIDISFFSSKEYAMYKEDIPLDKLKDWKESYLAEYNGQRRTIQLYPAYPKKTKFISVK